MLTSLLDTILPFIAVLTTIIFIHEYGHYIVARWCGVHAEVFSIGLGKEIVSRCDKRGTKWRIALLPIGGYVKFLGDSNAASMPIVDQVQNTTSGFARKHSFPAADLWKRAAIVAAGPIFNFILSIFIFSILAMVFGLVVNTPVAGTATSQSSEFIEGDIIKSVNGRPVNTLTEAIETVVIQDINPARIILEREGKIKKIKQPYVLETKVSFVTPGGAADKAGLKINDVVLSIDRQPISSFQDIQKYVGEWTKNAPPLSLEIKRNNKDLRIEVTPKIQERSDPLTQEMRMLPTLGISNAGANAEDIFGFQPSRERLSPLDALWFGADRTYSIITMSLSYISDLITSKQGADQLSGPIGIARVSGDAAQSGIENFLAFIAIISTSIGLLNLFPIPILDGGHLVFYALEAVRGKPASQRVIEVSTTIGITLLLGFMMFATWNDIMRL